MLGALCASIDAVLQASLTWPDHIPNHVRLVAGRKPCEVQKHFFILLACKTGAWWGDTLDSSYSTIFEP